MPAPSLQKGKMTMPKLDADKLFEDIEVNMDGKDYKVTRITEEMLENVQKFAGDPESLPEGATVLDAQLGVILNVPHTDLKTVDARKKTRVVKWLTKVIGEQLRGADAGGNADGNAAQESV